MIIDNEESIQAFLGRQAEAFLDEVLDLFPSFEVENPEELFGAGESRLGPLIDRVVQYGGKILNIEAKYQISLDNPAALDRAARQIAAVLQDDDGGVLLFSLKLPDPAALKYLAERVAEAGEDFSLVHIESDPIGLFTVMRSETTLRAD